MPAAYDSLQAAWRLRCPQDPGGVLVSLDRFRSVSRLPGPARPPAFHVQFLCPACGGLHAALLAQGDLDCLPVTEMLPVHHDLMSGRADWEPGGLAGMWARSIAQGRWPLAFTCQRTGSLVGGWPSQLRALEPDRPGPDARAFLVHYECPACGQPGCEQWPHARLSLRAPAC